MCDTISKSCKCRAATLHAYNDLRENHDVPESFAFEAACIVYQHHHPEQNKDMARLTVESWIHAGHLH